MNIQQVSQPISVEYQLLQGEFADQMGRIYYEDQCLSFSKHKYSVLLIEGDSYALEENT